MSLAPTTRGRRLTRGKIIRSDEPARSDLWLPISDLAVNGSFYDLGVLRRDEVRVATTAAESSSTVFYGRYTASINYFRRISSLIPGQSGAAFEEQIFGSSREDVADTPSRRRYPVIAVKLLSRSCGCLAEYAR